MRFAISDRPTPAGRHEQRGGIARPRRLQRLRFVRHFGAMQLHHKAVDLLDVWQQQRHRGLLHVAHARFRCRLDPHRIPHLSGLNAHRP
jgi:hypothetical protein